MVSSEEHAEPMTPQQVLELVPHYDEVERLDVYLQDPIIFDEVILDRDGNELVTTRFAILATVHPLTTQDGHRLGINSPTGLYTTNSKAVEFQIVGIDQDVRAYIPVQAIRIGGYADNRGAVCRCQNFRHYSHLTDPAQRPLEEIIH